MPEITQKSTARARIGIQSVLLNTSSGLCRIIMKTPSSADTNKDTYKVLRGTQEWYLRTSKSF